MSTDGQQPAPSPSAGQPQLAAYPSPGPYAPPGTPYLPPYPQGLYAPNPGAPFYPQYGPGSGAPQPPAVWPVALFTFFFGLLGAFSASGRAKKARALGVSGGRYWGTFAGVLAATWLLTIVVGAIIAVVASSTTNATRATVMDAPTLERSIVQQGNFKTTTGAPAKATAAACVKVTVSTEGVGTYRCIVDFADAGRRSYHVTVDPNGAWVTDSGS